MKGIILAGGTGSRLYPITQGISKQLLPVYNKPMIYYPMSVLMLAGIQDILIITSNEDVLAFQRLLGDGSQFGVNLQYAIQNNPEGIAHAFIVAESFIGSSEVCLVLGDNIFYGQGFTPVLDKASQIKSGAMIFGYPVADPERFGIVEFDQSMQVLSVEEKPAQPKSDFAITGLYFYDNQVADIAKTIQPSSRGELEITCINQVYLEQKQLNVQLLGRGFAWLDTGTYESLLEAGHFVQTIERRQGLMVACLEEIAWKKGWITSEELIEKATLMKATSYGTYLTSLLK